MRLIDPKRTATRRLPTISMTVANAYSPVLFGRMSPYPTEVIVVAAQYQLMINMSMSDFSPGRPQSFETTQLSWRYFVQNFSRPELLVHLYELSIAIKYQMHPTQCTRRRKRERT